MILPIYYFLCFLILLGAGIIVFTKNIVHAAYALGLSLIGLAGVYVVLMAEFLAVVQIMLYAGGVVILLVFGVMMTNRLRGEKLVSESRNVAMGGVIATLVLIGLLYTFSTLDLSSRSAGQNSSTDNVTQIGVAFLTEHIVAFELIAFILLVALVGATYLAKMAGNE